MAVTNSPVFNGIHRHTGKPYLFPPGDFPPAARTMWVPSGLDRNDLRRTGWCYVMAGHDPNTEEIQQRLSPLFAKRTEDSQGNVVALNFVDGMTAHSFLRMNKALYIKIDPKKCPFYLLLVGSPLYIPFNFQFEMASLGHVVGRLHFEDLAEYSAYAATVVNEERAASRPRRAVFWAADHENDPASKLCTTSLTMPLAAEIQKNAADYRVDSFFGPAATKNVLKSLFQEEVPAFLFTSGHGLYFTSGDENQREEQGALICSDWQGPKSNGPNPDQYLSALDLGSADTSAKGLISFHFACNSAGTPLLNNFYFHENPAHQKPAAPEPFVSKLAQTLLGQSRGNSLAFIGHVERTWTTSFLWIRNETRPEQYSEVIGQILAGSRLGAAFELFSEIAAQISASVVTKVLNQPGTYDPKVAAAEELGQIADLRGFVIIGDPAIRISAVAP